MDRDGTLIEEKHYLASAAAINLLPGTIPALQQLNRCGIPIYLFTNQAGVAHGYFTEANLAFIHLTLLTNLNANGVSLRGILYCPHHPKAAIPAYRKDCFGRKPNPGLLIQAAYTDKIWLPSSYVIGDKLTDIAAGKNAGVKTILVLTGYGREELRRIDGVTAPDFVAADLAAAVMWILADRKYPIPEEGIPNEDRH